MRRILYSLLLLAALLIFAFGNVQSRQDEVLESLGAYEHKQLWTHGDFQDFTDFGVYSYSSAAMEGNQYFTAVSEHDIESICAYIDDFEKWIEVIRSDDPKDALVGNYAFDREMIDCSDYFYIYENEDYPKFGCYDVWFFDTQTMNLYYFHSNI